MSDQLSSPDQRPGDCALPARLIQVRNPCGGPLPLLCHTNAVIIANTLHIKSSVKTYPTKALQLGFPLTPDNSSLFLASTVALDNLCSLTRTRKESSGHNPRIYENITMTLPPDDSLGVLLITLPTILLAIAVAVCIMRLWSIRLKKKPFNMNDLLIASAMVWK